MKEILSNLIKNTSELQEFLTKQFYIEKNLNLTYFNQHTFNIAYRDKGFRNILEDFYIYQEGIGNYLSLISLGFENVERIDSTEVLFNIFNDFCTHNKKIFIIGDSIENEILEKVSNHRKLNLVGYHNGFFSENQIDDIAKQIEDSKAEFVVIGMGSPKQEFAVLKFKESLSDVNFLCVGNFLRYYFGLQKRAPLFFRKLQLEWFYRFLQEPKRLFSRYLVGIPLFFIRVVLIFLKK